LICVDGRTYISSSSSRLATSINIMDSAELSRELDEDPQAVLYSEERCLALAAQAEATARYAAQHLEERCVVYPL
jgi:hypothetical protein